MQRRLANYSGDLTGAYRYDADFVREYYSDSYAIPEVQHESDYSILRHCLDHGERLSEAANRMSLSVGVEGDMSKDRKTGSIVPVSVVEACGGIPDSYGQWMSDASHVWVPFYEGKMMDQYDPHYAEYVSGSGRSSVWKEIHFPKSPLRPQFLMPVRKLLGRTSYRKGLKAVIRRAGPATNQRSVICALIEGAPGSTALTTIQAPNPLDTIYLCGVLNSFVFDYLMRMRMGATTLPWYLLKEVPIPQKITTRAQEQIARLVVKLSLSFKSFARVIAEGAAAYSWWPDPSAEPYFLCSHSRRMGIVQINCLVAKAYRLEPDQLDWILSDDRSRPTGFWRVDKSLSEDMRLPAQVRSAFTKWCTGIPLEVATQESLGWPCTCSESQRHFRMEELAHSLKAIPEWRVAFPSNNE